MSYQSGRVTIKDVAAVCGVSCATVSRDRLGKAASPEDCARETVEKLLSEMPSPIVLQQKRMR